MAKNHKIPRPKLATWLFERGLTPKTPIVGERLGVSYESVRRYCLPFDAPGRVVPPRDVLERIVAWTEGEVTVEDFYEPQLLKPGRISAAEVQP